MATEVIQVAAVTAPDQWALGAGADKVVAVNAPDDDDSSYISSGSTNAIEQYSIAGHTIPAGSVINSVSVHVRLRRVGGTFRLARGFVAFGATRSTTGFITTTLAYVTTESSLARPGGGSWSFADLASLEAGVLIAGGDTTARCTSVWLIVDYTPPSPSNMFLMFRP